MKNLFIALAALVAVGCSKSEPEMISPITITNQTSHVWHNPCFYIYDKINKDDINNSRLEVIRFTKINGTVGIGESTKVSSYGGTYFSVFFEDGEYNAFSHKQKIIGKAISVHDALLYR